jgi:hypothetical protein
MNKLGDFVLFPEDEKYSERIEEIRASFCRCCDWIAENSAQSREVKVLHALLRQSIPFLELAIDARVDDLPKVSLAARFLFESEIRATHILADPANLTQWEAEAVTDGVEVIDGFLTLRAQSPHVDASAFEKERARLLGLAQKYSLGENTKHLSARKLAKDVGRESDFDAFFKIYSKLLHPSSYFVNGLAEAHDGFIRDVLVTTLQENAISLVERVRAALGVPQEVVLPRRGRE